MIAPLIVQTQQTPFLTSCTLFQIPPFCFLLSRSSLPLPPSLSLSLSLSLHRFLTPHPPRFSPLDKLPHAPNNVIRHPRHRPIRQVLAMALPPRRGRVPENMRLLHELVGQTRRMGGLGV